MTRGKHRFRLDTELAKKRYVRVGVSLQFKKFIVVCFIPIAHTNPCSSENAKHYLVFTFYSYVSDGSVNKNKVSEDVS